MNKEYPRPPAKMDPFKSSLLIYMHLMSRMGLQRITLYDIRE